MGEAALARARGFTWDSTASGTLAVMDTAMAAERPRLRTALGRSESGKAAGLAAATLANSAIQLVFTVVFTRLLGRPATAPWRRSSRPSSSCWWAASPCSSRRRARRRSTASAHPEVLRATLRAWTQRLLVALVAVTAASVLLREQLATLIGVDDVPWAAAAIPPTGVLWMLLSLQRGALQGLRAYARSAFRSSSRPPGGWSAACCSWRRPRSHRRAAGHAVRLHPRGVWLERELHRIVGPSGRRRGAVAHLRSLVGDGWVPIVGLFLLASLQNVDVIVAKHTLSADAAGSYAAAAVAAKAVVWVAIGIGLHLLPEATRRAAAGLDPRPVLLRALGICALIAAPALVIFAAFPTLLLRLAFGPEFTDAADALLLLGAAMTLLAVAYLTVQYMIALGETRFLWVLGVVAIAEPFLLTAGEEGIVAFAAIVFGVQCVAASSVLALGLTARRRRRRAAAAS